MIEALAQGAVITNDELTDYFTCSNNGGMRRSHATNTLVLVSDHTKGIYDDRWVDDVLQYTGMGLRGPQRLDFAQNRTLAESETNGVAVHLFEVFEPGQYTYIGEVALAGSPYEEEQPDADGVPRLVWVFPLRMAGSSATPALPTKVVQAPTRRLEKLASRMDDEALKERARLGHNLPGRREVSSKTYARDPFVAECARRRAAGKCQLCGEPAPFEDRAGTPYLEIHHVEWLSRNGSDVIENVVALCPNCHRRMHVLDLETERARLALAAREV